MMVDGYGEFLNQNASFSSIESHHLANLAPRDEGSNLDLLACRVSPTTASTGPPVRLMANIGDIVSSRWPTICTLCYLNTLLRM